VRRLVAPLAIAAVVAPVLAGASTFMAATAAAAAAAVGPSWTSFQGGPQHLGESVDGPAPGLRSIWRWPATPSGSESQSASAPVLVGGHAIALTRDQVVAVDARTGAVAWRLWRASGYLDAPAVDTASTANGALVFTQGRLGQGSSLVAVDLSTRADLWRFPSGRPLPAALRGAPIIADGLALVGASDGLVHAVDMGSGAERWAFQTGGTVQTSPAAADGRVFAIGEDGTTGRSTLFAIDAASGKEIWSFAPPTAALHVSAPTVAGGRVFEAFGDGMVRAFDARRGTVLWSTRIRGLFSPLNALAYTDGSLLVLDATGALYDFDATTGDRRWDFQFRPTCLRGAPLVAGGSVYVGLDDGTVAAVQLGSGRQVWSTALPGGSVGGLAAGGGMLIAPYAGEGGGLIGFQHSDRALEDIESPTVLHLGVALGNYGIAFLVTLGGLLLTFGVFARRRAATLLARERVDMTDGDPSDPEPSDPNGPEVSPAGGDAP
jgi:outer membrane protein assembly factor BamB